MNHHHQTTHCSSRKGKDKKRKGINEVSGMWGTCFGRRKCTISR